MVNKTAFVAYSGQDNDLAGTIKSGVQKANSPATRDVHFEIWEYNDIYGASIISPIFEKIESSSFVVADITYLNENVVYEMGYTIGRKKKVYLIKSNQIAGDQDLAKKIGIFDTIGYSAFSNDESLRQSLQSHISEDPLPFAASVDVRAPVYVLPSIEKQSASTTVISRIKKARYRYRSFSSSEEVRLSATDAISQVAKSAGVVVMLNQNVREEMIRGMFVAGLADGMGKPLLMMAPAGQAMPLDVRDNVKPYRSPDEISEIIAEFYPEINAKLQDGFASPLVSQNLLASLSVGEPTAENEMTTLDRYYLQTDQFLRAYRGEVNLVVGRKGSGKTALFIMLRDSVRADRRNIVVDLKPESYQLLKLKDEILEKLAEGSRQHLITAFWEYLILLEVTYKLLEKDRNNYLHNHQTRDLYEQLEAVYRGSKGVAEGDFSERVSQLSSQLAQNYSKSEGDKNGGRLSNEVITEILYSHDLRALKDLISKYLDQKGSVLVLFDNLDKSWSTKGVDDIDAITLRCLIDASRKVERDMQRRGRDFRCMVFVRNDVYQHLMENSADYGKEMRTTLDWSDPDMLREMLRLRLISAMPEAYHEASFEELWLGISESHVFGEESSSFIIERSLMRPRNVLKLFNHVRAFAVNFRKEKIDQEDYYKGLKVYSQDLLIELDRELSDVFPRAKDLLYYFMDSGSVISLSELEEVIREAKIPNESSSEIRDFLLYHGVLGLRIEEVDQYIFDVGYDLKKIQVRLARLGEDARFVLNPAFAPALEIKDQLFDRQAALLL